LVNSNDSKQRYTATFLCKDKLVRTEGSVTKLLKIWDFLAQQKPILLALMSIEMRGLYVPNIIFIRFSLLWKIAKTMRKPNKVCQDDFFWKDNALIRLLSIERNQDSGKKSIWS
jgi:hypothetical protein